MINCIFNCIMNMSHRTYRFFTCLYLQKKYTCIKSTIYVKLSWKFENLPTSKSKIKLKVTLNSILNVNYIYIYIYIYNTCLHLQTKQNTLVLKV